MCAHNELAGASLLQQPVTCDRLVVAARVLGQLADPTRLQLLRLLAEGEQDVNTLTAQVAASRSSVSQHLGRLRLTKLVRTRRDGRRILYRIAGEHLNTLVEEALQFAGYLVEDIPTTAAGPRR
jgi:DNA-binding transcriptional ArsR family regulator